MSGYPNNKDIFISKSDSGSISGDLNRKDPGKILGKTNYTKIRVLLTMAESLSTILSIKFIIGWTVIDMKSTLKREN